MLAEKMCENAVNKGIKEKNSILWMFQVKDKWQMSEYERSRHEGTMPAKYERNLYQRSNSLLWIRVYMEIVTKV